MIHSTRRLQSKTSPALEPYTFLLGRILLCLIFVGSGFNKVMNFGDTAERMAGVGIPVATVALVIAIIIELGGALCVIIGFRMRWAAGALILFVLLATYYFHNPLTAPAEEQQMQMIQVMKNLSIIGGLLLIASIGYGPVSVERDRSSH